ncbi:MAG: hypothetical protein AB7T49_09690 [Oligoflexales bacterium]
MKKNKALIGLGFSLMLGSFGWAGRLDAADGAPILAHSGPAPVKKPSTKTNWSKYPNKFPAQNFKVVRTTKVVTYKWMRETEPLHLDLRVGAMQTDSIPIMPAAGLGVLYYPGGDWAIGLTGLTAEKDITKDLQKEFGDDFKVSKTPLQAKSLSGLFRFFWLWNFYLDTGIGLRTVDVAFDVATGETTYSLEMHTWTVTLDVDIGNQWNFTNGCFLGVNWVGYSSPMLTGKSVAASVTNSIELEQDLPVLKGLTNALADGLADDAAMRLLVLYAGYSF